MAMVKKNERGNCPFNGFKKCRTTCSLFRSGMKFFSDGKEPVPFESCAINVIADNAEMTHQRTYTLQKEFGELKNISAFSTLVALGLESQENLARIVKACLNLPNSENNKQIELGEDKK